MNEIWKDIPNYEGKYQVSNIGRVKSLNYRGNTKKEMILKPIQRGNTGYIYVDLYDHEFKHHKKNIHRLVAEAFIPNPDNLPCVNHKNEDKTDNQVENLEWCGDSYNQSHSYEHGLSRPHFCAGGALKRRKIALLGEGLQVLQVFGSARAAAAFAGTQWPSNISSCCEQQSKGHDHRLFGLRFVYLEDVERIVRGEIVYPRKTIIQQFTLDGELIAIFPSLRAAAKAVGRTEGAISQAVKKGHISAGFRWCRE